MFILLSSVLFWSGRERNAVIAVMSTPTPSFLLHLPLIARDYTPAVEMPTVRPSQTPPLTTTGTPTAITPAMPTPSVTAAGSATIAATPTSGIGVTATNIPTAIESATRTATGTAAATPSLVLTPLAPFGVQMFEDVNDTSARERATETGIRWVRLVSSWASSNIDGMVTKAIDAGLEPVVVLGYSPDWATEDVAGANQGMHYGCGPIDPADLRPFADAVQQLVERYDGDGIDDAPGSPVVRYWEFWNEPDNQSTAQECIFVGGCWGGDLDNDGVPDSQEYVTMLSWAYSAVKAASLNAQVLLGALAWEETPACFNTRFLDEVLSYGGTQYFDLTNFHQYDFRRSAWDGTLPWNQGILGKIAAAKAKVAKPVVVSEIGLNRDMAMGEERQARHLVHEMVRGMSLWPDDVKSLIWFLLVDEASNPTGSFGLLDRETLNPFPAYYAYQTLTTELGEVDPTQSATQLNPSETGSVYIQAYRFAMRDGGKKLVLWTDDGQKIKRASDLHISMAIGRDQLGETWRGALRLRVVDSTSYPTLAVTIVDDGSPGDLDGDASNNSITLEITQDPIYVEVIP